MTEAGVIVPSIVTDRLELVSMPPEFIETALDGDQAPTGLRLQLPLGWVQEEECLLRLRLAEMHEDPSLQPWLLRAIVVRDGNREMVGHIGFHGPPNDAKALEIGYAVFPGYRRRGIAIEAVEGMLRWAGGEHLIERFIASVSPTNVASLALVRKLGFAQVGRQWDERDGEELVFELVRSR
ncbi:MAG: GNAT family N-acetyltransferase [Actinomycetota bacterium]